MLTDAGFALIVNGKTLRATGIGTGAAEGVVAVTTKAPEVRPATRPLAFGVTVRFPEVCPVTPLSGVTLSHEGTWLTAKATALPLPAVTMTVCDGGLFLPCHANKVREPGFADKGDGGAVTFTFTTSGLETQAKPCTKHAGINDPE
jgi:hypothetical protein